MAIQNTMTTAGRTNDIYVTRTAFYWSIGIIILLLTAVTLSMAKDITRLTVWERSVRNDPATSVQQNQQPQAEQPPVDLSAELPPVPQ
ncbi:MAG: hypothetical protein K0R29_2930 [Pseudobdellovibrio sp.]|jgi:hypothetical protein|nr:hypothetical protein [Pseudobdellovibrio sp.]